MKQRYIILICVLILPSCATSNFTSNRQLQPNQGLVLAKCKTAEYTDLFVYEADYKPNLIAPGIGIKAQLHCSKYSDTEDKVILVALNSGEYILANSGFGEGAPKFYVQPNKINYIGDFNNPLGTKFKRYDKSVGKNIYEKRIVISNNLEKTKSELFYNQPELKEKYQVVSSVAGPNK